jgi:hypothetical protein
LELQVRELSLQPPPFGSPGTLKIQASSNVTFRLAPAQKRFEAIHTQFLRGNVAVKISSVTC